MLKLVFLIQIWFDMASFEQQINALSLKKKLKNVIDHDLSMLHTTDLLPWRDRRKLIEMNRSEQVTYLNK